MNVRQMNIPFDPIIAVIADDVAKHPVFKRAVGSIVKSMVVHRETLHPSDDLLEAWYRFKENRTCRQ